MKLLPPLCLALLLAPGVRAGDVIDATQYMPIGQFNAWEMIDKALWNGGLEPSVEAEPQIVSIGNVIVVDGVARYNIHSKLFSGVSNVVLQVGVDQGVLYLFAARLLDPESDFGSDDIKIPMVFFDQPVPLGDTTTELDADFATTPVTASIQIEIDLGPKEIDGQVDITGSVTARWNSVAPILTPLGLLGDVGGALAELEIDVDFSYFSPDNDINDELPGGGTHKGVRGVLGPGYGFVQIDGKGEQQKILNRAVLPGELVSNPAEPDVFPALPPGDMTGFAVGIPEIAVVHGIEVGVTDGGITDGTLTLDGVEFDLLLGGALEVSAQLSSLGAGPVDLLLKGSAKMNPKTGGLKLKLNGKTKKLTDFAKPVVFSANQELLPPFGDEPLLITWKAGKDPETKEPIGGVLEMPLAPVVATSASVVLNTLVDDPVVKKGLLSIGTKSRRLAGEGVLLLGGSTDGGGVEFPVYVIETVKLKEGLPATRTYKLCQTGRTVKLFGWSATSTSALDYALTKFSGRLLGVKIAPESLDDVEVSAE